MEKTGLIFAHNEPIEELGQFLVTLCVSKASLRFFIGFFKLGCFPKKILTCSLIDYNLEHLSRGRPLQDS
jgi:hypothetical protein